MHRQKKFANLCSVFKFLTWEITQMSVFWWFIVKTTQKRASMVHSHAFSLQSATQHLSLYKCTKFKVSILIQVCFRVILHRMHFFLRYLKENAPKKCEGNIFRFSNMFSFNQHPIIRLDRHVADLLQNVS